MAGGVQSTPGDLLVFISYRRQDTSGYAGRLYDALIRRFRPDQLFMDVDAIPPGVDFAEYIQAAVGRCDALLALIGPAWLLPDPETGKPRLDDPNDYVRLEIEAALDRKVRVVPILLQGARLPHPEDLPEPLRPLLRRNALEMSDGRWRFDAERLIEVLEELEAAKAGKPRVQPARSPLATIADLIRRQPTAGVALGAAAVLVLFVGLTMSGVMGRPAASSSPTAGAITSPSATASPSDSASPSSPTVSESPSPSLPPIIAPGPLTPGEVELASRIGSDILYQGTERICERSTQEGASAAIQCTFDPGGAFNRVHYWLYETTDVMKAAYRTWRPKAPVKDQQCAVGVPGESVYRVGTEPAGTLGCYEATGDVEGVVFVWTNERLNVLSHIVANPGTPLADVFAFWRDRAGPFG